MPLWKIYHPVGAYGAEDKQALAERITRLYKNLPRFYVGIIFQDVAANPFISAANPPISSSASGSTISRDPCRRI